MEQTNLLSLTNDSGVEGCSSTSVGITASHTELNTTHAKNSDQTSAIDLSEVNTQDDIPLDDDSHSICEQNSDIFELNDNPGNLINTNKRERDLCSGISKIGNRLSSDSNSTFEMVDFNSPGSDDWCKTIRPNESDGNLNDERDTFSPVNSEENISCLPITETTIKLGDNITVADVKSSTEDNNLFRRRRYDGNVRSSTKEEKQRQNEEIVILESSSISSETGSWEALFPNNQTEIKESCKIFLMKERSYCDSLASSFISTTVPSINSSSTTTKTNTTTNSTSTSLTNEKFNEENMIDIDENVPNTSRVVSACFIDASSLLDESEIPYVSFGPRLTEAVESLNNVNRRQESSNTESSQNSPDFMEKPLTTDIKENSEPEEDSDKDSWPKQKNLDCLNSFHPVFEKCKSNPIQEIDLNNDECNEGSILKEDPLKQRQEMEKMQGHYLFKNSIQQFSTHLIDPPNIPSYSEDLSQSGSLPNLNELRNDVKKLEKPEATTIVYPDTPYNSIIQIESIEHISNLDNVSPRSSNNSSEPKRIPKKIQKCDESAPIVSGGASIKDFTPEQGRSPLVRRKIDNCPIVSGGAIFMNLTNETTIPDSTIQTNPEPPIHNMNNSRNLVKSWIVDMSDCNINKTSQSQRSGSSSSSNELNNGTTPYLDNCSSGGSISKNGSLGYFVGFEDLNKISTENSDKVFTEKSNCDTPRKISTGFYVDLSENNTNSLKNHMYNGKNSVVENNTQSCQPQSLDSTHSSDSQDKKNIFSMFIDFGDKKPITRREPFSLTSKLSSSLNQRKSNSGSKSLTENIDDNNSNSHSNNSASPLLSSLTKIDETKPSEIIVQKRNNFQTFPKSDLKRHSWNTSNNSSCSFDSKPETDQIHSHSHDYKRSSSLTTEKNIMSILDKIPLISKTSSMSIDSSISPYDDFSCTKSDFSINSNNSGQSENKAENDGQRKRRKDVKINETFDKSSQGSITDGIFSKDSSPLSSTETDDVTFQNEINKESKDKSENPEFPVQTHNNVVPTMESLQATIEKQRQLLETVTEVVESPKKQSNLSTFVKLSDMDKPITKFELHSPSQSMTNSSGSRVAKLFYEPKSYNSKTYFDKYSTWNMSRSTGTNLTNIATSLENSISLSRIFPHLSKVFSSSVPSDVGYNSIEKSFNEMSECVLSEMSYTSSMASSRSGFDSNDESSISYRQPRRLGEDLLKMFLQEIATDVTIEVGNHKMRAHKCILQSRCQYFAALLAGGWVENAGNVMPLPGYSYDVVHFALCHIYSGAAHPPEGISLMELAALADLLCLEGLKEVTAHALRTNYCHNFHKPCSGCIDGVVQVLPVSLNHGLDDLYRKCLKWVCRNFVKVWPTRSFAQLNYDIICRCRQQIAGHMNSENVLNTYLDCENLLLKLGACKWANNIEHVLRELTDISENYISDHFANLIASDSFLLLGHGNSWYISRLENLLLRTASTLTPDQACKSYQRCTRLNTVLGAKIITVPTPNGNNLFDDLKQKEEMDWDEDFIRLVSAILSAVEQCLTRQCARAMKTSAWQRLDIELRKKIQQLACLSGPVDRKSRTVSKYNFNPNVPSYQSRSQDLHQVRLAIQAHNNRRSISNDNKQYRASTYTQTNNYDRITSQHINNHTDKSVQANREVKANPVVKSSSKASVSEIINKTKNQIHKRSQSENIKIIKDKSITNVPKLNNIKPRYLEPKKPSITKNSIKAPLNKTNRLSSSESSTRTSSPAGKKSLSNKKINDSNISLDSLTSPARAAKLLKSKTETTNEYSGDSLGESMKSSIKTDKTVSHESLLNTKQLNIKTNISKSNPVINKEIKLRQNLNKNSLIGNGNKNEINNKNLSNTTSATTTTNSSINDINKKRGISITTTTNKTSLNHHNDVSDIGTRKSFLTPKSREILLKKKNIQNKSAIPVNTTTTTTTSISTKSTSASPNLVEKQRTINKSSSSSCVPIRRTTNITNLNKQKLATARLSQTQTVSSKLKSVKSVEEKIKLKTKENLKNVETEIIVEFVKPEKIESKLERSSTFCKEVSDIPSSELEIIE